jgi:signal transduction histidine kinase
MGLKAQDQQNVFQRFYRVEDESTRGLSGFGIGLYLSAEIIRLHQGKIAVESEEGKGAEFYFLLPLQADWDQLL